MVSSYTISSIPFFRNTDGNRLQMASNHLTQAIAIENPEIPYLVSINTFVKNSGLFILRAPFNMKIIDIYNNILIYNTESNKKLRSITVPYYHDILVKPSDVIEKNTIISKYRNIDSNNIPLVGKNCNIVFNYWDGFVFEDACVITDQVKEDFKGYIPAYYSIEMPFYKKIKFTQKLDDMIIKPGIFANYYTNMFYPDLDKTEEIPYELRIKYILTYVPDNKEARDTYKMQFDSTKSFLDKYNIEKILSNTKLDTETKKQVYSILENTFKTSKKIQILIFGEYVHEVEIGDKFTNRHGNKGVVSTCLDNMPTVNISKVISFRPEFCLNPEGIRRMNLSQLGEMHYSFILKYVIPVFIEKLRKNNVPDESIYNFIFKKFIEPLGEEEKRINLELYNSIGNATEVLDYVKNYGMRIIITNGTQKYLYSIYDMIKYIETINISPYIVIHNKLCSYGVMYMLRLHHTSVSKISFKDQRIGEQEVWILGQTNPKLLQELFIRSDNKNGFEHLLRDITMSTVTGVESKTNVFNIPGQYHSLSELKAILFALNVGSIDVEEKNELQ